MLLLATKTYDNMHKITGCLCTTTLYLRYKGGKIVTKNNNVIRLTKAIAHCCVVSRNTVPIKYGRFYFNGKDVADRRSNNSPVSIRSSKTSCCRAADFILLARRTYNLLRYVCFERCTIFS